MPECAGSSAAGPVAASPAGSFEPGEPTSLTLVTVQSINVCGITPDPEPNASSTQPHPNTGPGDSLSTNPAEKSNICHAFQTLLSVTRIRLPLSPLRATAAFFTAASGPSWLGVAESYSPTYVVALHAWGEHNEKYFDTSHELIFHSKHEHEQHSHHLLSMC